MTTTPPESAGKPAKRRWQLLKSNREMTIAAVSFASGGLLMGFGCHLQLSIAAFGGKEVSAVLSGIGSIVTGLGTFALAAAGFAGVQRWAKVRRQKRLAGLAEEVLEMTADLCVIMSSIAMRYPNRPGEDAARGPISAHHSRLIDRAPNTRLEKLVARVAILMDDDAIAIFRPIWWRWAHMAVLIQADIQGHHAKDEPWLNSFHLKGVANIEAERLAVREHFRKLAALS